MLESLHPTYTMQCIKIYRKESSAYNGRMLCSILHNALHQNQKIITIQTFSLLRMKTKKGFTK